MVQSMSLQALPYIETRRAHRAQSQTCTCAGGDHVENFILKRVFTEKGEHVQWAGLREAYFGSLLQRGGMNLQVGCPQLIL